MVDAVHLFDVDRCQYVRCLWQVRRANDLVNWKKHMILARRHEVDERSTKGTLPPSKGRRNPDYCATIFENGNFSLPLGVAMGFIVMLMPFVDPSWTINVLGVELPWTAYVLLILIGLTSGYFVVPMNALLQHRGHVLLSAGHSIAVQNFNEQLNILLMVAVYTVMLWLDMPINVIIWIFGLLVATLMVVMIRWNKLNQRRDPNLLDQIGQEGHGKAL